MTGDLTIGEKKLTIDTDTGNTSVELLPLWGYSGADTGNVALYCSGRRLGCKMQL